MKLARLAQVPEGQTRSPRYASSGHGRRPRSNRSAGALRACFASMSAMSAQSAIETTAEPASAEFGPAPSGTVLPREPCPSDSQGGLGSLGLATSVQPSRPLVVLICGDRHWKDGWLIQQTLAALGPVGVVVHGGCWGADRLGGWAARRLGIPVEVYPAEWDREGKAAGPHRNERMLAQGHPDLVLAFHDDLQNSRGTRDMLVRAVAVGIRTRIVSHACPEGTSSLAKAKLLSLAAAVEPRATQPVPTEALPAVAEVQAPPSRPRGPSGPRPRVKRDGSRTSLEARLVIPLEGEALPTRASRFTLADITSGLQDDSREADERQHTRQLADVRGRVKAARAALSAHPGAEEVLTRDWVKEARFYARFGITQAQFRHGVPADGVEAGPAAWEGLNSPLDWMSEVRAREAACLPDSDEWG